METRSFWPQLTFKQHTFVPQRILACRLWLFCAGRGLFLLTGWWRIFMIIFGFVYSWRRSSRTCCVQEGWIRFESPCFPFEHGTFLQVWGTVAAHLCTWQTTSVSWLVGGCERSIWQWAHAWCSGCAGSIDL